MQEKEEQRGAGVSVGIAGVHARVEGVTADIYVDLGSGRGPSGVAVEVHTDPALVHGKPVVTAVYTDVGLVSG